MKRITILILLLYNALPLVHAQGKTHQIGTVVRMRMTDCMSTQHGFMATMSGGGRVLSGELCPEYVLVTDTVVFVIMGKTSAQLLALADETRFRMQKNEMLIRADDARKESHFQIKQMMLRPEWERYQTIEERVTLEMARHHTEEAHEEAH
jgi:hypothetical protein